MLDKVRAAKDVITSLLAALSVFGFTQITDDVTSGIVGIVTAVVALAVTLKGGGNNTPPAETPRVRAERF